MSIKYCKKTRRQFLLGTGKTVLALPLLPSLLSREAFAQSAGSISPKMMLFHFDHNNLDEIWIPPSAANTPVGNIGARQVLLRSLSSRTQAGFAFRNVRYQNLINNDLVTMIRGFDTAVAYGPGHGNFAFACAEGRNSQGNHPTLDTIIEGSEAVYPAASTGANVTKALRASLGPADLFYQRSGSNVQVMPVFRRNNIQNFYNEVFSSLTNGTAQPVDFSNQLKSNILNRVFGSFRSFRNNRRI